MMLELGIIAGCGLFLVGVFALRNVDRNPHGRPDEPENFREGYDD